MATTHRVLLFLYAETPVHAGADASVGALDLPIQREITTDLPIIKGESLKGALREHFRPPRYDWLDAAAWSALFGDEPPKPDGGPAQPKPGGLRVHEAQLVAFPVPTLENTFAWVTSPLVQARLARKARVAGVRFTPDVGPGPADGTQPEPDHASRRAVEPDDTLCLSATAREGKIALGPYLVGVAADPALGAWSRTIAGHALPVLDGGFFTAKFGRDTYLGSDALLTAVSRDCAPVVARVQLGAPDEAGNPTKTVANGPFYSEYLPTETLLVALLECEARPERGIGYGELFVRLCDTLDNDVLRVGGDETIGKGLMWCRAVRAVPRGAVAVAVAGE